MSRKSKGSCWKKAQWVSWSTGKASLSAQFWYMHTFHFLVQLFIFLLAKLCNDDYTAAKIVTGMLLLEKGTVTWSRIVWQYGKWYCVWFSHHLYSERKPSSLCLCCNWLAPLHVYQLISYEYASYTNISHDQCSIPKIITRKANKLIKSLHRTISTNVAQTSRNLPWKHNASADGACMPTKLYTRNLHNQV